MVGKLLTLVSALCLWSKTSYEIDQNRLLFWRNVEGTSNLTQNVLQIKSIDEHETGSCESNISLSMIECITKPGPSDGIADNCQGLIGLFRTAGGPYAAVIMESADAEHIGTGVRRVKEIGLIKVPGSGTPTAFSSDGRARIELHDEEVRLMQETFSEHSFYFSTKPNVFDVTKNTQANALSRMQGQSSSIGSCDSRFFWNHDIASPVLAAGGESLITPICNIWTDTIPLKVEGQTHNLTLVARRSRFRQGPRFLKRGMDQEGNVANFVETEQILKTGSAETYAYAQVRGSLPLFWSQLKRDWKLKPKIKILGAPKDPLTLTAARLHLAELQQKYCNQDGDYGVAIVNLIDKAGIQMKMGQQVSDILTELGQETHDYIPASSDFREEIGDENYIVKFGGIPTDVKYTWYDYHFNVDNFGIQHANALYSILRKYLDGSRSSIKDHMALYRPGNYFAADKYGTIRQLQQGIIRTNCVDCLDRTNVVQSLFSKWVLSRQLEAIHSPDRGNKGLFSRRVPSDSIIGKDNMKSFRGLWADHGDAMSMLYAGTRALKRDITRFGKRTGSGILSDGVTVWQRYINSNFKDGDRQTGINIVLGKDNNANK